MIELLGLIAMIFAVVGTVANNRRLRWCFLCYIVSNSLTAFIHWDASIWSLWLRDMIFIGLAIEGLFLWRRKL